MTQKRSEVGGQRSEQGILAPDLRPPTSDLFVNDTIVAVATATGSALRGVVRVSGPDAVDLAARSFVAADGCRLDQLNQPTAVAGHAIVDLDGVNDTRVPCDLLLWPGSRSYTREPLAELHVPGSPPLVAAVLEAVCCGGARLAEPGEFTQRAFLAGRIDLTQAEAVLGVIDAHDAADYRTALGQLAGGLGRPLDALRDDLIQLLAELEAGLDFVDEDIEFITSAEVVRRLSDAACLVANVQQQMATRADQSPRAQAVLLGPPNVGKSSLFNALLDQYGVDCQASAIVSAERGTTRDYLLANLDLDGTRCQLVDTAGTGDDGLDEIDRAAQSHSRERGQRATVRLQCVEARQAGELVISTSDAPTLVVVTKADTIVGVSHGTIPASAVVTSVHTGQGIADLTVAIRAALKRDDAGDQPGVVASTAERCRESLRLASQSLAMASDLAENDGGDELIAAEIHTALHEIGKVVGAVSTDDILDRVFSSFCIGK